jgi:hypothetical protein
MRRGYTGMLMELYARPGADLGQELPLDGAFTGTGDGDREVVIPSGAGPSAATAPVSGTAGLYTLDVSARAGDGAEGARATIRCLAADGAVLVEDSRETAADGGDWQDLIVAVPCPDETARIAVALENAGAGDAAFRAIRLRGRPAAPASGS